jgi:hypothetical protein
MRYRMCAVLILFSLSACENRQETPPQTDLIGQWRVEFHGRGMPGIASGRLQLSEQAAYTDGCRRDPTCTPGIIGSHEIDFSGLLQRQLLARVLAGVDEKGRIALLVGSCCDRGELSAIGRLRRDTIRGTWTEQFLEDGRRGRFVMTRVPE